MSWTSTDGQVRNLAKFLWRRWNPNGPTWAETNQASRDEAVEEARAVLVAAGPTIAAQALRDAAGRTYHAACAAGLANDADRIEKEGA
jgi:hypothetical protein